MGLWVCTCVSALFPAPSVFLTASNGRWPQLLPLLYWTPRPPSPGRLQAQNTQQTGFKGNLRLLLQTLEQPHLPFKILPAALSHRLHTDACWCLLLPLLSIFTTHPPPSLPPHPPQAREDALLILCFIVQKREGGEVGVPTCTSIARDGTKEL